MPARGNRRKKYIVNRRLQYRYLGVILVTMLVSMLTVGFLTFYVIWHQVIDQFSLVPEAAVKLAAIFAQTSRMLIGPITALLALAVLIGIRLSHKVAGPLYSVGVMADAVSKGRLNLTVQFRKGDELPELAASLNSMIAGIKSIVADEKALALQLAEYTCKLTADLQSGKALGRTVRETIDGLNEAVERLKTTTAKFVTE